MSGAKNLKSLTITVALAGVLGGGGYFVWQSSQDPAGLATGRPAAHTGQVWARLQNYKGSYLRRFMGAFDKSAPTATDALEAFNELAYQVSGPGGFWRKEVPNHWLGCKAQPDSASCGAIQSIGEDMGRWDALQEKIVGLNDQAAGPFLDEHATEIMDYLDTMVPDEPSSAGMQKTRLFEKSLKSAMEQDGIL